MNRISLIILLGVSLFISTSALAGYSSKHGGQYSDSHGGYDNHHGQRYDRRHGHHHNKHHHKHYNRHMRRHHRQYSHGGYYEPYTRFSFSYGHHGPVIEYRSYPHRDYAYRYGH